MDNIVTNGYTNQYNRTYGSMSGDYIADEQSVIYMSLYENFDVLG